MLERFRANVVEKRLLHQGERIVVAFSAGPDSLALLTLLNQMRQSWNWQLAVAHLDHQLQPESVFEAEYVRTICEQLGLPCFQEKENVAALAAARKLGIEEAGRDARYRFLIAVAREFGATAIVFGHQADDQLEHFWMRLLRGASPAALAGIPESRNLEPGLRLVRPLLPFSRAEIEEYLKCQQFIPFQDPDNELPQFERNKMRHQLMPYLDRLNPSWREHVHNTMAMLGEDEEYLHREMLRFYNDGSWHLGLYHWDYQRWCELHPVLRKRVLRHIFRQWPISTTEQPLQYRHLMFLERSWGELQQGQRLDLPAGYAVQRAGDDLFFLRNWPPSPWQMQQPAPGSSAEPWSRVLPWSYPAHPVAVHCMVVPREMMGWGIAARRASYVAKKWADSAWLLRSSSPGDTLLVGQHRRKLGELFRSLGIPLPERHCYPMLVIGGENAALPGLVTADSFKPEAEDSEALLINIAERKIRCLT